jgi:hypothetical protein
MESGIMLGKRFIFGIVAMVCITTMACYLRLPSDAIIKLVGIITGLFLTSQTITDSIKKK